MDRQREVSQGRAIGACRQVLAMKFGARDSECQTWSRLPKLDYLGCRVQVARGDVDAEQARQCVPYVHRGRPYSAGDQGL